MTQEVERLQGQVNQGHKTIKTLEMKLKSARHLLDVEKGRRIAAENDKNDMVRKGREGKGGRGMGEGKKRYGKGRKGREGEGGRVWEV